MDDGKTTKPRSAATLIILGAGMLGSLTAVARADATCTQPASAPPICLSGTITAKGHDKALVEATGVAGSEWLKVGDAALGWTVVDIGPDFIVVEHQGQRIRLEPEEQGGTIDVAAPSSPPLAPVAAAQRRAPGVRQGPMRHPKTLVSRGERPAND